MNLAYHIPAMALGVSCAGAVVAAWRIRKRKPVSVRGQLVRNRRDWSVLAVAAAAWVALWSGLFSAGLVSLGALLAGVTLSGYCLIQDVRRMCIAARALRTYDANPLAAMLVELHAAFDAGSSGRPEHSPANNR